MVENKNWHDHPRKSGGSFKFQIPKVPAHRRTLLCDRIHRGKILECVTITYNKYIHRLVCLPFQQKVFVFFFLVSEVVLYIHTSVDGPIRCSQRCNGMCERFVVERAKNIMPDWSWIVALCLKVREGACKIDPKCICGDRYVPCRL